MDNLVGKTLGNRYEILSQIGEGGMAIVYKAKCHVLNRLVAIKVLKPEFVNDDEFIEKFKNEAMSAGGLNQQNIISIYDVQEENGVPYIVMEYVEGGNIKDIIHRQGKIDKDTMLNYAKQIALALKEAHQHKIVHRDIKSQNIMITKNNMVKVADFGIAKAVSSSTITAVGTIMGSVHYFSPEQARGGYIDERSDIYSMGIVMYEMITGKLPFDGDSPVTIALKHLQEEIQFEDDDNIPSEVKDLIRKATQKSPDRRYKSVDALIDDIEYVQNSKMVALGMGFEDETYRTQIISTDDDEYKILFTDLKEKNEEKSRKSKKKKVERIVEEDDEPISKTNFAIIAAVALLASALFISGFFFFRGAFGGDAKVATPKLVGKTVEEATALAKDSGLEVIVSGNEVNVNFEPGQISSQDPAEGTKVSKGSEIKVVVSEDKVVNPISVPKLTDMTIEEAQAKISELGLVALIEYKTDVLEANKVISQSPVEGYLLEKGERVRIVVSLGLDESQVTVPDVTNKTLDDAKEILNKAKLSPSISYRENKDKAEGIVLSQVPASGAQVAVDSQVSIVVNRYDKPLLKSMPIVITLSQDRDSVKIEIVEVDTGEIVVTQTVNPIEQGGTVALNVQGEPGTSKEYYVYLDGDRTSYYANPVVNF